MPDASTHTAAPLALATPTAQDERRHRWFGLFLLMVFAQTTGAGIHLTRVMSSFVIGDWLISYAGGFVRRGLPGSVALWLGHALHLRASWIVFAMQVCVLALLTLGLWQLSRRVRWTITNTLILLSPATIALTAMDLYAGVRKEVLVFAALALVLCLALDERVPDWLLSLVLTVSVVLVTLSHEGLLVTMPYFVAGLWLTRRAPTPREQLLRLVRICAVPTLLGLIALAAVATHAGTPQIAAAVCSAAGGHMVPLGAPIETPIENVCNGSIEWLALTLPEARAFFLPVLAQDHFALIFGSLLLPVFFPFVFAFRALAGRDGLRSQVRVVLVATAVSLLGTAALAYIAMDWGRWIHMQAMCLLLMVMLLEQWAPRLQSSAPRPALQRWVVRALVFAYCALWTFPSTFPSLQFGYVRIVLLWGHLIHHWH